jgi:hypothetical protein
MGVPLTAAISNKYPRQVQKATRGMADDQNGTSAFVLNTQDTGGDPKYLIYIYNLLNLQHIREQPPLFHRFVIPACEPGQEFAFTTLAPFHLLPFEIFATYEKRYEKQDGRKSAMSLVNPNAYPGTEWRNQLADWRSIETTSTGDGDNLNRFGVFWSLTRPDELEKLRKEIKQFRDIAQKTMEALCREGDMLAASNELKRIGTLHHFAMDYTGKLAGWHTPMYHMVPCPNCGESVREGLAFHKNFAGEKCIVDIEKYKAHMRRQREIEAELAAEEEKNDEEAAPTRKPRRKTA